MSIREELAALCLFSAHTATLKKIVLSRPVDGDIARVIGTLRRIGGEVMLQMETLHTDHDGMFPYVYNYFWEDPENHPSDWA